MIGALGGLSILAWLVVAWLSNRRQPWLLAPLPAGILVLLLTGHPWWSLLPLLLLTAGVFAELVIGAREPPTLRTSAPEAPLSTERWAAAVAAPFRVALAEPWDLVVRPSLRYRYRRTLAAEWGVNDRASLLAAMDRLWQELQSGESADLVVDLRTATASVCPDRSDVPQRTLALSPEQVARLRRVTGAAPETQTAVIGAYEWWKSAHLIRLACGGATLDWLSPVETHALLRRVAANLQRRYTSWQELAQAFHGGYLLWRGGRADDSDRVWTALGLLTTDPQSPWNLLPWDMPLERVAAEPSRPNAQA